MKNNHSSSPSEEPSLSGIEREPSAYSPLSVEVQPQEQPQPLPVAVVAPAELQVHVPQTQSKISPSLSRNDLGTYSSDELKSLSDEEKLLLIRNACRPDPSYKYPHKLEYGKKCSFQHTWLRQFPWLCYSKSCNGGFCVNCVLFARHCLTLGQLVTTPMTTFTRAKVTLQEHSD